MISFITSSSNILFKKSLKSLLSTSTSTSTINNKKKIFVIVESPAKARTLNKFLPPNYIVDSCVGHIRDLGKKSNLPQEYQLQSVIPELNLSVADVGIDVNNDFKPLYTILDNKLSVISRLKSTLNNCDELLLATDEDREGEAISWHLVEVLKPKVPHHRAVFHEITEKVILDAFNNPRNLNKDIVASQEARRILDRLVGFTLSPILWKYIGPNLSAGRVQSCGLYLCVEKEKKRWNFIPSNYYSMKAYFSLLSNSSSSSSSSSSLNSNFPTLLGRLISWNDNKIASVEDFDPFTGEIKEKKSKQSKFIVLEQEQTNEIANILKNPEVTFTINNTEKKKMSRNPPLAFTTSTLQQECSSQLKLSPSETMALAQSLYENSYITYMRTDSSTLGQNALNIAVKLVENKYSPQYVHPQYQQSLSSSSSSTTTTTTTTSSLNTQQQQQIKKQVNAQEAHEAIRPTTKIIKDENGNNQEVFLEPNNTDLVGIEKKLYELIYKRTLQSVMSPAQYETSNYQITAKLNKNIGIFRANEKKVTFPGYQILSKHSTVNNENSNKFCENNSSTNFNEQIIIGSKLTLSKNIPQKSLNDSLIDENDQDPSIIEDLEEISVNSDGILMTSHQTHPPQRYTESSFIRELETAGVGRPSTYASILQTLEDRGYIQIDKRTIIPTVKGIIVSNLLAKYFPEIVFPEFTSNMESSLDRIASGKLNRTNYLKSFYLGNNNNKDNKDNIKDNIEGLKYKAIHVNATSYLNQDNNNDDNNNSNNSNNNNSFQVLDIPNLREFGKLIYTGNDELILETSEIITNQQQRQQLEQQQNQQHSLLNTSKPWIRRWKLPISGDIRKLTKQYLCDITKGPCDSEGYDLNQHSPLKTLFYSSNSNSNTKNSGENNNNKSNNNNGNENYNSKGQWIGVWNNKNIILRTGRYGPYLDYDKFFCSIGSKKTVTLEEAISIIEKKLNKVSNTK